MALLTEIDIAEHLGVSLQTVRRWRRERLGPPFVKMEASVRYRQEDVGRVRCAVSYQDERRQATRESIQPKPGSPGLAW